MSKVEARVEEVDIESDDPPHRLIAGVEVTCTRCDHSTSSYGTGDNSIRRCLALLREECPEGERNFYVTEDSDN